MAIESLSEVSKVVWVGLESLILGVSGENSYLGPVHSGSILGDLPKLFENPCGVYVDDEEFAGAYASPIGGDDAVDVLRGREQERDVLLLLNCLEDCVFDRRLVRKLVIVALKHGAFEEHEIDVANRALYEILEEHPLPAMRAKVAAVEQALALGFDEEGVGIGGGVIDEVGSDGEVTDGKRVPGLEVVEVERISVFAEEHLRRVDQAAGQPADVDRSAGRQCSHQTEVVLMRMADQKRVYDKTREVYGLTVGVEGKSGVEKNRRLSG